MSPSPEFTEYTEQQKQERAESVQQVEQVEQAAEVIERVDPARLVIGANVRRAGAADRFLVESMRALGVIEPVTAYRDDAAQGVYGAQGQLVVLRGQRRTLAAQEAGVATIPVRIVPAPAHSARIVEQLVENERREAMPRADVVTAFAELADLGMSRTRIAKQTGSRPAEVKAALSVAASTSARETLESMPSMTLDQAAALAEVEDDHEAYESLVYAATHRPESWAHVLQQVRDRREAAARMSQRVTELTQAGWRVVRDDETDDTEADEGDEQEEEADELGGAHDERSWVRMDCVWAPDPETGRSMRLDASQLTPAEDLRVLVEVRDRYDSKTGGWRPEVIEHAEVTFDGLTARGWRTHMSAPKSLTAEQEEQERETARQERRTVREGNAAWRSACKVRAAWIGSHLVARKTPPKGAEALIAWAVLSQPYALTRAQQDGHQELARALGIEGNAWQVRALVAERVEASSPRAATALAALAIVLGWQARSADALSWRSPTGDDRRILAYLDQAGYELADIEAAILAKANQDGHDTEAEADEAGHEDSEEDSETEEV